MLRRLLLCAAAGALLAAAPAKILIIGDSISIGYTPGVTERLKDRAEVTHHEGNAAHTKNGVEKLESWLGENRWDLITFNFGLHDLKIMDDGKHQVPIETYEANLEKIAKRLKKTGAKLLFFTTTPVPEGKLSPLRVPGDEVKFNAAAVRVMKKNRIPVVDLYGWSNPRLAAIQGKANVHFTKEGRDEMAAFVAAEIEKRLGK